MIPVPRLPQRHQRDRRPLRLRIPVQTRNPLRSLLLRHRKRNLRRQMHPRRYRRTRRLLRQRQKDRNRRIRTFNRERHLQQQTIRSALHLHTRRQQRRQPTKKTLHRTIKIIDREHLTSRPKKRLLLLTENRQRKRTRNLRIEHRPQRHIRIRQHIHRRRRHLPQPALIRKVRAWRHHTAGQHQTISSHTPAPHRTDIVQTVRNPLQRLDIHLTVRTYTRQRHTPSRNPQTTRIVRQRSRNQNTIRTTITRKKRRRNHTRRPDHQIPHLNTRRKKTSSTLHHTGENIREPAVVHRTNHHHRIRKNPEKLRLRRQTPARQTTQSPLRHHTLTRHTHLEYPKNQQHCAPHHKNATIPARRTP